MKVIKSDYYNNPDRIMIGVDITTLTDVFEENYREDNGVDFDWNKDGDRFNEASRELDVLIENVFVKMFGNAIAESYDDDTYVLTFWGDRNNPNDIKTLQELQGRADDTWRDNGRVQLAIYDTEFYTGNQSGKFADKWGDIGKALVDAITVEIDFPEEFDSDPMYDRVDSMNIRNSRQIKSSRKPIKSANYNGFNLEARRSYGKGNGYFTTYPVWDTELDTSIGAIEYHYAVENPYYVAWVYNDFGANKTGRTKDFDTEEECLEWIGEELASGTTARDKLLKYWEELGYDYKSKNLNNSRKYIKSSAAPDGLTFDSREDEDGYKFIQYKITDQGRLDKIKGYCDHNEDELQLGKTFLNLMYDESDKLLDAQLVDTDSSTWEVSPEECVEVFGSSIETLSDPSVDKQGVISSRKSKKSVKSGLDFVQKGEVILAKKGTKVVGYIGQNADKEFYYGLGTPGKSSGVMVVSDFNSAAKRLEEQSRQ